MAAWRTVRLSRRNQSALQNSRETSSVVSWPWFQPGENAAALVPAEKPKRWVRTEERRRARPQARGPLLSRGFPRLLGLCTVFFPLWNKILRTQRF